MNTLRSSPIDLRSTRAFWLAAALCLSMIAGCGGGYGGGGGGGGGGNTGTCGTAYGNMGVPPTITTQPMSQTAHPGASVTFSVTATPSSGLTYQWMFNGTNIMGATMASYMIQMVTSMNAGQYAVNVTNACGTTPSSPATLTVM
jgi:hypothetical protein